MVLNRKIVKFRLLQMFMVICLSLLFLVFATNTYAASNRLASHLGKSGVGPHSVYCDAEWVYNNLTKYNDTIIPIGPTLSDYNGTGSNATATFSSSVSGTVSITASYGVKVSASAVVASVEGTYGVSVSASLTATLGNAFALIVPAHRTVYAQYGVWDVVTSGHYYYIDNTCKTRIDDGTITTYSPSYVGWNTWIR